MGFRHGRSILRNVHAHVNKAKCKFYIIINEKKGCITMKKFEYTINDPVGIHARPAGLLAKKAKALGSTVTIAASDGRSATASKLMALMGLGIKQGDTVTVIIEGGEEEANAADMEQFFKDNL